MTPHTRLNEKLAELMNKLATVMMKRGEPFKARAYSKAEETILSFIEDITDIGQLRGKPGIGETIMEKLKEYVETGTLKILEREKENPLNFFTDNNRELETIVQECILMAIRESIPTEAIIRAYMDESVEQEEEVIIENIEENVAKQDAVVDQTGGNPIVPLDESIPDVVPSIKNVDNDPVVTRLTFNDIDSVLDETDRLKTMDAPKSIERLEEISTARAMQRRLEEESSDDEDDRLHIHNDLIDLSGFDILDEIDEKSVNDDIMLNDVEELP